MDGDDDEPRYDDYAMREYITVSCPVMTRIEREKIEIISVHIIIACDLSKTGPKKLLWL